MVSAVSRGTVVGPSRRAGPWDATDPEGERLCAVPAWRGGGRAGKAGRAFTERNPGEKKYHARWDTSRLTGADRTSNRTHNNYVCGL
jgi:hypothetical protein